MPVCQTLSMDIRPVSSVFPSCVVDEPSLPDAKNVAAFSASA